MLAQTFFILHYTWFSFPLGWNFGDQLECYWRPYSSYFTMIDTNSHLMYFGAPAVTLIYISDKSDPVAVTQLLVKSGSSTNANKWIFLICVSIWGVVHRVVLWLRVVIIFVLFRLYTMPGVAMYHESCIVLDTNTVCSWIGLFFTVVYQIFYYWLSHSLAKIQSTCSEFCIRPSIRPVL